MDQSKPLALISVYDKTGLLDLAQALHDAGIGMLSSGGTAKAIKEAGLEVTMVEDYTNSPEILGGRVKTLHPKIHGGLLAKNEPEHLATLKEQGIAKIDFLIVNLYPFYENQTIENIDIGGVALLRAGAKNFESVHVLSSPSQYKTFTDKLKTGTYQEEGYRKELAKSAFQATRDYDSAISKWYADHLCQTSNATGGMESTKSLQVNKVQTMRYGENPHQEACFYLDKESRLEQIQGIELSYNNMLDSQAAWDTCYDWVGKEPTASIIKHVSPCGVATAPSLKLAYEKARESDPTSAFGGVVAFNQTLDEETAALLKPNFLEVIIAPDFSKEAVEILKEKERLRLIKIIDHEKRLDHYVFRSCLGGYLAQTQDAKITDQYEVAGEINPDQDAVSAMLFSMQVCKHVKSNAITLCIYDPACKTYSTVGIGGGLTSRVDAAKLAVMKYNEQPRNKDLKVYMASDAFLPFPDALEAVASQLNIGGLIQTGGSKNDKLVIEKANQLKIPMLFTGIRHFKH